METKKTDRANLESYIKLFRLLGLVLTLLTVYVAIEYKVYEKSSSALDIIASTDFEEEEEVMEIKIEQTAPPPPAAPSPEIIEIVEDVVEVEETVIETTETDEFDKVEVADIVDVEEEEEEIVEDVPFAIIEKVPIYPGCEKMRTREDQKNCLNKEIQKHVGNHFNIDLASELGLTQGRVKIYVQFKITKTGNIEIIGARAPHVQLEGEAKRVVNLLPKLTPGEQRGKPVNVSYMLPIAFEIR